MIPEVLKNYISNLLLQIADELNVKEVILYSNDVSSTYRFNTMSGDEIGFEHENEWMLWSLFFTGEIIDDMAKVREVVKEGLKQRQESNIKVRQPLSKVELVVE